MQKEERQDCHGIPMLEACQAQCLHEDDIQWAHSLRKASLTQTGHQLQGLFVMTL